MEIKNKNMEKYIGALDHRTEEEKTKDFRHEEIFGMAAPLEWIEKDFVPHLPIRNQDGSGSCGGVAGAIMLGRNNLYDKGTFVPLNFSYIYNQRKNKNYAGNASLGMEVVDLMEILKKKGSFPDPQLTSDNIGETEINNQTFNNDQIKEALEYRGEAYFFSNKNINTLADIINRGLTPVFLLRCMSDEYTEDPKVLHPNKILGQFWDWDINHYIAGIDYGMRKYNKVIACQEGWGVGALPKALRYFTQDFINARVQLVGYIIDLKFNGTLKPQYDWKTVLEKKQYIKFGHGSWDPNEKDPKKKAEQTRVKALQEVLKHEKFFPSSQECTGYFGGITARALIKWQVAHGMFDFQNEKDMRNVQAGPSSLKELVKEYQIN